MSETKPVRMVHCASCGAENEVHEDHEPEIAHYPAESDPEPVATAPVLPGGATGEAPPAAPAPGPSPEPAPAKRVWFNFNPFGEE